MSKCDTCIYNKDRDAETRNLVCDWYYDVAWLNPADQEEAPPKDITFKERLEMIVPEELQMLLDSGYNYKPKHKLKTHFTRSEKHMLREIEDSIKNGQI